MVCFSELHILDLSYPECIVGKLKKKKIIWRVFGALSNVYFKRFIENLKFKFVNGSPLNQSRSVQIIERHYGYLYPSI